MQANPVLVQIVRGDMIESFFRGSYVVADFHGHIIDTVGDGERLIYPRSSLKPIQALGMMESGAADSYNLTPEEIALSCASHNGEDIHVTLVNNWLTRLGVTCDVLECGIHAPMGKEAEYSLVRKGHHPTQAQNACSGKHAGFVTQALHLKVPITGYIQLDHPVQQYVNRMIEEITETNVALAPKGIDGCRIPVIGLPLKNLAKGMAKFSQPKYLGPVMGQGAQNIISAMQAHPILIAGSGRFCTQIIIESKGKILAKMGADGVFSAILPDKGWGIALKMDDGGLRAAEVALMGVLDKHNLLDENPGYNRWLKQPVKTWGKEPVGFIQSLPL